jgi:hypothetical protein
MSPRSSTGRISGLRPRQAVTVGVLLTAAGSWLLFEGYEQAGRPRPWLLRFLPGP